MGNRRASANAALLLLLAALSFFMPATGSTTAPGVAAAAAAASTPWQLPEETHHHPVNQASAVGDRLRRDVPPGPSYVPAALTFAALLAATIVVGRPVRGRVLSRGPDSPGRSRLTDIGIDRQ